MGITYLDGVEINPKKIDTILKWPQPNTQKDLRSFLDLTGYYRRFIKNYAYTCRPLIDLLKKDGFVWPEAADKAFQTLNDAMTTAPVLALPNFELPFEMEMDASSYGIGVVLQ